MAFPYISQICVNDCFTYQNLLIPSKELKEFRHIIITGKNGSGKTTILEQIVAQIHDIRFIQSNPNIKSERIFLKITSPIAVPKMIAIRFLNQMDIPNFPRDFIFSFFTANRAVELEPVSSVIKEEVFTQELNNSENFIGKFKQYLVNKKIYEAFEYMNSNGKKKNYKASFFEELTTVLRAIFEDTQLTLEFVQEDFEFYLRFSDGRRVTFDQLSAGFSAFLSIVMELLMRTDLIQKAKKDFSHDPEGIVLIDEPETHFHLSMQYEILPLLTNLFPNIQFVIATHSPAVISSASRTK